MPKKSRKKAARKTAARKRKLEHLSAVSGGEHRGGHHARLRGSHHTRDEQPHRRTKGYAHARKKAKAGTTRPRKAASDAKAKLSRHDRSVTEQTLRDHIAMNCVRRCMHGARLPRARAK
jgi:hypothetical protein